MRTIEAPELKSMLDNGAEFRLVMTMGEWAFRAAHIPGSEHFGTPEEAFSQLGRTEQIVVYCSDPSCIASRYAYDRLIDEGFVNVAHFAGGLEGWARAGFPLEGELNQGVDR